MILWAEPAGAGSSAKTVFTTRNDLNLVPGLIPGRHGEKVYSKVRRFIVVIPGDEGYCSALWVRGNVHARRSLTID